jgi:hypothetical protein
MTEHRKRPIRYDPATGHFFRDSFRVGSPDKCGRIVVWWTETKRVLGHRLAVYLMTGAWPAKHVLHIDGDPGNNAWANLEQSTSTVLAISRKSTQPLTAERVRELYSYDSTTGVLCHRFHRGCRAAGSPTGNPGKHGHLYTGVDGATLLVHRLIWLYVTGAWPEHSIDHIDGNPRNNAWANLRAATQAENMQNMRKAVATNKSGVLGAHTMASGRFSSKIRSNGRPIHLGVFDTAAEAHAAYVTAKRLLHPFNTL